MATLQDGLPDGLSAKFDRWVADNVPALGDGRLQAELISGGSTNIVIRLTRGGHAVVLRRAPAKAPPASEKAIEREAKIIRALAPTDVPHPKFHAECKDPELIGAPFYVMDLVDGWAADLSEQNVTTYAPRFSQGPDQHYLGYAMVDGMIKMAGVDYKAVGLADLGRPDGFLERQVDRWMSQLASYPSRYPGYETRDIPGIDTVTEWLRRSTPKGSAPGLMHGDYAMNNVLFAKRPPARLAAIIDWETATIGDPLLDLASYVQHLVLRDGATPKHSYFDPTNFPRQEDAVEYYADATGRDVSDLPYYIILYKFRMACLVEYKVAEAAAGLAPKAKGERFDKIVRGLISDAEELVRKAG